MEEKTQSSQEIRKEIVTFLVITFALSVVFWVPIGLAGMLTAWGGLFINVMWISIMWCPGIAALVTRFIYHRNLRGLGWGWGKTRYQILSYVLPVAYALAAYSVVWLSGLGGIKKDFSIGAALHTGFGPFLDFVAFATIGVFASSVNALGEEIGWRGLLVPQLAKLTSFTKTSLISGVIWAVWHYPLVLFGGYRGDETPAWYQLLCFTVMVIGISFAFSWLPLKSGSLWTAVFIHANHNLYIQGLFDPLTVDTGITEFIIGEFGMALAVASLIVAFMFWRMRSQLPETHVQQWRQDFALDNGKVRQQGN